MDQNVLSQSDCRIFIEPYCQNKSMKQHVEINSHKLNVDQKSFGWALPKMDVANLIMGPKIDLSQ